MIYQYREVKEFESKHRTLFYMSFFVEAIIITINFISYSIGGHYLRNYKFHFNLKVNLFYAIITYLCSIIVRIVLILYEAGILTNEPIESDETLFIWRNNITDVILICSIIRVFYFSSITTLLLMLGTERFFATILIGAYEKKRYSYISVSQIAIGFIASFIFSGLLHFEILPILFLVIAAIFLNIFEFSLFYFVYWMNFETWKVLQTREVNSNYSLSFRFQLNENMKILKWMKNISIVINSVNITISCLFLVANDVEINKTYPLLTCYFYHAVNLAIALYGLTVVAVAVIMDKNFRTFFLKNDLIRSLTMPFFGRFFPEDFATKEKLNVNQETNIYFTSLMSQWDEQIVRKNSNSTRKKSKVSTILPDKKVGIQLNMIRK